MKKLIISSLIGLAASVAALGLLGGGSVEAGKPDVPLCFLGSPSTGVVQHGNVIIGTSGSDTIDCSFLADGVTPNTYGYRIFGLGRNDNITGSHGDDLIMGGSGDDILTGWGGSDRIDGGRDFDKCIGGEVQGQLDNGDTIRACENTTLGDPNT